MKKTVTGLVLAGLLSALATAQGLPDAMSHPSTQGGQVPQSQGQGPARPQAVQTQATSLEGKLGFENSLPVLVAANATYSLDMRDFFYYAYFDGLKAGDGVKVEGYLLQALPGGNRPVVLVTKAVIGGKTYDLGAATGPGFASMNGGPGPMVDSHGGTGGRP